MRFPKNQPVIVPVAPEGPGGLQRMTLISPAVHRPAAFRRPRLLVVGCGDVGQRVLAQLGTRYRVCVLSSSAASREALRRPGVRPLAGNLDQPATLGRLAALAPRVLHLAPPPAQGSEDTRTRALLHSLARGAVRALVYGSTSGVYGDAGGERFDETRRVAPATDRARRRVDAEARLRHHARAHGMRLTVLRIPGIYANDRAGHPRERLARGTPVLRAEDDVFTNHIHADDLARACIAALHRGAGLRVIHASDDSELRMGDYFDFAARILGLPPPARISREAARAQVSDATLSFMSESRRLINERLKKELRVRLRYPTPLEGLTAG